MGAYAPYSGLSKNAMRAATERCLVPIARALARNGISFRGVLYAGIMLTKDGPRVLEYNVRFGDPEAEVLLPLLADDALEVLAAVARGELAALPALQCRAGSALTVVAAARGYPGLPEKGQVITGIDDPDDRGDAIVFHAGTAQVGNQVVTAGGRVLAVTGLGATLPEARAAAYRALDGIHFEGMFFRRDIGGRASARLQEA
jgi:phosphoribosylamine--glycine ligase